MCNIVKFLKDDSEKIKDKQRHIRHIKLSWDDGLYCEIFGIDKNGLSLLRNYKLDEVSDEEILEHIIDRTEKWSEEAKLC